jgi:poly-beta-1,6-N-acetyl-D-glucosamine synthase
MAILAVTPPGLVGSFSEGDNWVPGAIDSENDASCEPLAAPPSAEPRRLRLSIVTCAYNEEANIGRFIEGCLAACEARYELAEIIVVASGCTDQTPEIVTEFQARDSRIRLVVQPTRLGKASALGLGFRQAVGDVVLVAGSDTSPAPAALDEVVRPFYDPSVSLVCSRPVPMTEADNFMVNLLRSFWEIHLEVSAIVPKAGEAYAVRNRTFEVPVDIQDDDTYLGAIGVVPGTKAVFAEDAIFFNRVPDTPADFLRQRWRVNRQVLGLERATGIKSVGWLPLVLLRAVGRFLRQKPEAIRYVVTLALAESVVRAGAMLTTAVVREPLVRWTPIRSTKDAPRLRARLPDSPATSVGASSLAPAQWHR